MMRDTRGFFAALIGDGRSLIKLTGICLGLSGAFAILQSATGHFLPHDISYLQMQPHELCAINECRIVHFMFHDRVSFGGSLIAIAVLYLRLAEFPLRAGEAWAWWTLVASGLTGFGSFLTYLGYGYLDTWHGAATLMLLPCFIGGLAISHRATVAKAYSTAMETSWNAALRPSVETPWRSPMGVGRALFLISAIGMIGAGCTIQWIGMTEVFVPTDLTFMGITRSQLDSINPRLVPLIAHDRAGFGGGVATAGLLIFASVWFAMPSRSLVQALFVGGVFGWGTAVGIHPVIGYNDAVHLAPAVTGAVLYFAGLGLTFASMQRPMPNLQKP